jgi:Lrp/AsnC family transcriptional regulator, leucine-responsive regulatory protein
MTSFIDQTDLRILDILQRNPRLPNKDIAIMTGKSASRVFERIARLKEQGIIRKVVAIVDNRLIDRSLIGFAFIRLKEHSTNALLAFEKRMGELEEVMEVYHMSGDCSFMLKVAVADMDEYYRFVAKRLSSFHVINNIKGSFVMRVVKNENAYKLQDVL